MKLANKVVVVTGAGSGIGRQLALQLLKRGARVAGVDINETTLRETLALAGVPEQAFAPFTLDVADHAAVAALPRAVSERLGAVDGIINCAGIIQPFVEISELDYAVLDRVFDVNWRGTLYMTKSFLPALLERPTAHVVNVSSMGGFMPVPGQTIYGASKAAVKLFTEGLHSELAPTNVRVTVVFPGAISTNIMKNSGVSMPPRADANAQKITTAERAARDILDGMERDRFRVLIGGDAKVLDALYRLNPQRAAAFIGKKMKELLS